MGLRLIQKIHQCRCWASFSWSHYFPKVVSPYNPGSMAAGFITLGFFGGERVQKQPAHFRIILTIYWAVNLKYHCRNSSPGCIKHEEKCECLHRWKRWVFPTLNRILIFVFWFQCNLFFLEIEHSAGVGCVSFRWSCRKEIFISNTETLINCFGRFLLKICFALYFHCAVVLP
jgi:hypothetical protein